MSNPDMAIRPPVKRWLILLLSAIAGCLFILLMTLLLGKSRAGSILMDTRTTIFIYPFTIQNFEHLLFFLGVGEIFIRWRTATRLAAISCISFPQGISSARPPAARFQLDW